MLRVFQVYFLFWNVNKFIETIDFLFRGLWCVSSSIVCVSVRLCVFVSLFNHHFRKRSGFVSEFG